MAEEGNAEAGCDPKCGGSGRRETVGDVDCGSSSGAPTGHSPAVQQRRLRIATVPVDWLRNTEARRSRVTQGDGRRWRVAERTRVVVARPRGSRPGAAEEAPGGATAETPACGGRPGLLRQSGTASVYPMVTRRHRRGGLGRRQKQNEAEPGTGDDSASVTWRAREQRGNGRFNVPQWLIAEETNRNGGDSRSKATRGCASSERGMTCGEAALNQLQRVMMDQIGCLQVKRRDSEQRHVSLETVRQLVDEAN
ncbi:hypothetical protein TRIUR3_26451 [Triticum urartu]|uniref:Uncharacterized protein n=1 Tax=Triticum urartu TaxID=4572 RepID=M7ZHB5_TRIUA|nr:hypothetical protein TRIUR3_26451 [Triticum urartu]